MFEFVIKILEVIIWPLMLFGIVFLFRNKIRKFKFKRKDLEVDFDIEQLSPNEVKRKLLKEASNASAETLPKEITYEDTLIKEWKSFATNKSEAYFKVEQLALSFFENEFNEPVQRNIRFKKGNLYVECDGFIKAEKSDKIIEIKLLSAANFRWIENHLPEFYNKSLVYPSITKRRSEFWLALVCDCSDSFKKSTQQYFEDICKKHDLKIKILIIRAEELGIKFVFNKP